MGDELLVWGIETSKLDALMRTFDAEARRLGAVGCAAVRADGKAGPSELNRAWLDEGPRAVEEAEAALRAAEGGPEDGR